MGDNVATLNMRTVLDLVAEREAVRELCESALAEYGQAVTAECEAFAVVREADPDYWARLVTIKAILSPGCRLDANISAALAVHQAMMSGYVPSTFDDVRALLPSNYGTMCYGHNVRSLLASWPTIRGLTGDDMTWDSLTALTKAGLLHGMGDKVRSWALALYDHTLPVYTLDRHMLRGLAAIVGLEIKSEISAKTSAYEALAALMVSIAEDLDVAPLVAQWSLWNHFRGATFASHLALAS